MKRTQIIAILALLVLTAVDSFGLNVVISNVVSAHQNEDQREYYTGRLGELVANTNGWHTGLTLFDGTEVGGYPLFPGLTPDRVAIVRNNGSGVAEDEKIAGTNLFNTVKEMAARSALTSQYGRRLVLIEMGRYTVPDTLVVSNQLSIRAFINPTERMHDDTGMDKPLVEINTPSNVVLNIVGSESDVEGIWLKQQVTSIAFAHFKTCRFEDFVCSNQASEVMFTDCYFNKSVNQGVTTMSQFEDCFFAAGATNTAVITSADRNWRGNNIIEAKGLFNYPGFATGPYYVRNATINGEDFGGGNGTITGGWVFENCVFTGSSNWFASDDGAGFKFVHCTGLPTDLAGKLCSVSYCTDANGEKVADM